MMELDNKTKFLLNRIFLLSGCFLGIFRGFSEEVVLGTNLDCWNSIIHIFVYTIKEQQTKKNNNT